jgi:hypothetical protein
MQMGVTFEKQIFGIFFNGTWWCEEHFFNINTEISEAPKNILIQGNFLRENFWHHL